MMITIDAYGKNGFAARFPYSETLVAKIRECLGFHWNKALKAWVSDGPEVLFDLQRFDIQFKFASPLAASRANSFYVQVERILAEKHRELSPERYAYQEVGTQTLCLQRRGILADDMGIGKTKQALDAAAFLQAQSLLVVSPKSIVYNWRDEFAKWYPYWKPDILPDSKMSRQQFWSDSHPFVLTNYQKLILDDWPHDIQWDVVIADEATALKNTRSETHKAFRRIANRANSVFLLTGTPLEMRVEELYGLMSIIRPGVFGNFSRFRDQHLVTDFWGNTVGPKNVDILRERIVPWMIRRTKQEVATYLPEKLPTVVQYVEMSSEEYERYLEIRNDFLKWLAERGDSVDSANPLTQLIRLQQYTSSPTLLDEEDRYGSKFAELKSTIEQWDGRVLVFTRFSQMAERLVEWLKIPSDALIEGEVESEERLERINRFNAGKLGKVFISTDAGAFGLNITGADLIIHYDLLWNPAKMRQREDRLHRIGQDLPVNVLVMACIRTLDEGMLRILENRRALFDEVIEEAAHLQFSQINWRNVTLGKE